MSAPGAIRTSIVYSSTRRPHAAAIAELYRAAPLSRPVDDVERIARLYRGSNVVITAWDDQMLVGILRGWTDGHYDGYVCDLAVHPRYQRLGVGRGLLEKARALYGPQVQWVLRASQLAAHYYAHIGWQKIENGWYWPRES